MYDLLVFFFPFFMMYLHRSFIDVNDRFLQKPFLQMVDEGIQLLFRSHDNPVDHHRPGKRQAHALPFGFLSIQGHRIPILLHHDVGNCRRRSNGMRNDRLMKLLALFFELYRTALGMALEQLDLELAKEYKK